MFSRRSRLRLACALLLAAASATGLSAPQPPTDAKPLRLLDDRGKALVFDAPPQRIVSLLPSLTETVCALGGCARLVGVDRYSNWPASVTTLPQLGGLDDTTIERLFALRPDVVLVSTSAPAIRRLESLGLKVMALESQRLADLRRTVHLMAQMLGHESAGLQWLAAMDSTLVQARSATPTAWHGAAVYVEVSAEPHAAGSDSFIGELLMAMGLRTIVPEGWGPFPRINPEFVVKEQPALIVISSRQEELLRRRPGWMVLSAVRDRRICGLDSAAMDLLVRAGPRLAQTLELLQACVLRWPAPAAGLKLPAQGGTTDE